MSGVALIVVSIVVLLCLFALGVPVLIAFLLCDLTGLFLITGSAGVGMFANSMFNTGTTAALVTIPLFLLVGEILSRGSAIEVMFSSVDTIIGKIRGRQYVLTIVLATIFGALSGTAMGVAAMLGRSVLPGMLSRRYDLRLSSGAIMAGASLAPIIPPSVLVIVIGTLAGVSISNLMVAGILPGLVLASLFLGYILIRVHLNPTLAPTDIQPSDSETKSTSVVGAFIRVLPVGIVILSIMGLIVLGIATPSEAAATGVVGSIITVALYRGLSVQMLRDSFHSAAYTSAMILVIMVASKIFSQLLAFTGATAEITQAIAGLGLPPASMLVLMLALPFVLCMFIDQIALMMVIIPIYRPIITQLGFDPLWFWLLFLINVTVGGMTPPFGYTIFALKGAAQNIPLTELFRAAWPFVALFVLAIVLFACVPSIVTTLPRALL
ncbi:MAG: tripartite ATP-independent transporter DctM subunit [Gammaproteobacteria bacterium]